jgi:hypothetical protein
MQKKMMSYFPKAGICDWIVKILLTDTYPLDEDQGSEVHVFVSQKWNVPSLAINEFCKSLEISLTKNENENENENENSKLTIQFSS